MRTRAFTQAVAALETCGRTGVRTPEIRAEQNLSVRGRQRIISLTTVHLSYHAFLSVKSVYPHCPYLMAGYVPVDDADTPKMFRTLRGFLTGEEPDEENYFAAWLSLRIHGDHVPFDEISERLGIKPTHLHRKGERRRPNSPAWRDDVWHFESAVPEAEPLERHIEAPWEVLRPHVQYLKSLKERFKVYVFCGYRSNCDTAGFAVSHKCLELFTALEVPFGVSVIVA